MAGTVVCNTLNTDTGLFSTNNAYSGIAKAWIQFNGGSSPTINGSFNVSSITYVSTGYYTINFATAMSNATYSVTGNANINTSGSTFVCICPFGNPSSPYYSTPTTSAFNIFCIQSFGGTGGDPRTASVVVFD